LLKAYRRPEPREAANIGTWLGILEGLSYIAVVFNCAILAFTSEQLHKYNPDITTFDKLLISMFIEHVIFILKFLISKFIPDSPVWVQEAYAKKMYFKVSRNYSKKF
jgi:hypothetical protein